MKIAVLGSGSWGTAVGHIAAQKGHRVTLLSRTSEAADEINEKHQNSRYLKDIVLCPDLKASTDPLSTLKNVDICILAVPAQHLGKALLKFKGYLPETAIPLCLSKGIEISSLMTMSQLVEKSWPKQAKNYAVLSGPSFARETALGLPTAVTIACENEDLGKNLREAFSHASFRVYSSTDIIGVELGGALKNVIAIAAGVCDGLKLGDNARAALITRGLAEITRLALKLGANPITLMGLSGMGDLVLTCTGGLSRNRNVGLKLGQGHKIDYILSQMHDVAEGIPTTKAVCQLAKNHKVELPIAKSMYRVLYENSSPLRELDELLSRSLREE